MTPIDQKELEKLRVIADGLPPRLIADWKRTAPVRSGTVLAAMLDLGCAAPRLLAEIERLEAIVDKEISK